MYFWGTSLTQVNVVCTEPSNKAMKLESLPGNTVIWQRVSNIFSSIDLHAYICQCWGDITTMKLFNIWLLVWFWRIHVCASASLDHAGSSRNKRRDSGRNRFTSLQQDTYQNWQACNTEAAHAAHNIYIFLLKRSWEINETLMLLIVGVSPQCFCTRITLKWARHSLNPMRLLQ